MAPLESFLRTKPIDVLGKVQFGAMDPALLVGTRPFLTRERLNGRRRRHSLPHVEVIVFEGIPYVIDGHHKSRRALENSTNVGARILYTCNRAVGLRIQRMKTDFISDLPIMS